MFIEHLSWHYWLNGSEFEQTLGDSDWQESLTCCSPWGQSELDMTKRLNNSKNKSRAWLDGCMNHNTRPLDMGDAFAWDSSLSRCIRHVWSFKTSHLHGFCPLLIFLPRTYSLQTLPPLTRCEIPLNSPGFSINSHFSYLLATEQKLRSWVYLAGERRYGSEGRRHLLKSWWS